MKLNDDAVDCLNRRCASTSLHGNASQTKVVIISVNTLIFTVRFVVQRDTILNKTDTAMFDDFVQASIGDSACCVYSNGIYYYLYIYIYIYIYIQGVPGGMCNTSGGCSLGQTIPI